MKYFWVRLLLSFGLFCILLPNALGQTSDATSTPTGKKVQQIEKLVESRDLSAVEQLKPFIADEDWYVRGKAAHAIGILGDKSAIALLTPLFQDANWFVRDSAIASLANLGEANLSLRELFLNGNSFDKTRAATSLAATKSTDAIDLLLKGIKDENPAVRRTTARLLGKLKATQATSELLTLLKDVDPTVRRASARAIGDLEVKEAIEAVREADHKTEETDWQYAATLYRLGDKSVLPRLTAALHSDYNDIHEAIFHILLEVADSQALPLLMEYGTLPKVAAPKLLSLRLELAKNLDRFGGAERQKAIATLFDDTTDAIRLEVVKALVRIAQKEGESTQSTLSLLISHYKKETSPEVNLEIKEALVKFDKNQVADLLLSKRDETIKPDEKTLAALKTVGVTITSLSEILKQGQTPERIQAVERLALLGDVKAVEPLLEALVSDKEQMIRVKAAQVLGQMKERRAVAPLLTSTSAKEKEIRLAALQALGEIRDYQAAEGLFSSVSDADAEIRKAALEALANIGISVERIKQDLTSNNWQTRAAALTTMGRLGDRQAIPIAVSSLKDKDYRVRVEAARLLGVFNDGSSVEGLLQSLNDNSAEVRVQAANTLGYIGDTRALSSLTMLLSDRDNRVSIAAAEALARLKDERATQVLLKALADSDWRIRSRSAQVLARVAADGVTSASLILPLTTALSDKDPLVRYYAAEALMAIGTPAIPGLLTNLKSTREGDRSRAARLLSRIGKPAVKPLMALVEEKGTSPDTKVAALHALGLIGDDLAVQTMVACLQADQAMVRAQAAESLGRFSSAVEQIIQLSKVSTATTREAAIEALGRMPQPQAVNRLLEATSDNNAGVRLAAVRALGETGNAHCVQTLIHLLREENSTLRGQAAASLARIGPAAVQELIMLSKDEHPSTRSLAIEALGEIGSSKAVAPLIEVLKTDTSGARGDAIEALGKIGDTQAIEPLLIVFKTGTTTIRKKAIAALSKFADRRSVEALVVALAEPNEEIRQLAVTGLGTIGDKSCLTPLERVAKNDTNAEVRDAAIRAIEQLKSQSRFNSN